jgi:hypothetical protein
MCITLLEEKLCTCNQALCLYLAVTNAQHCPRSRDPVNEFLSFPVTILYQGMFRCLRVFEACCAMQTHSAATPHSPIKAILVFTDPDDWGRDLQLCCDVMLTGGVLPGLRPHPPNTDAHVPETPIYFSQDDLLWPNSYQLPRFGLGAFRRALETLYHARTGRGLPMKGMYGKPTASTFVLARRLLDEQARQRGVDSLVCCSTRHLAC